MMVIRDKDIRKIISSTFKNIHFVLKEKRRETKYSLKSLDSVGVTLREIKRENSLKAKYYLSKELSLSYLGIITVGFVSLAVQKEDSDYTILPRGWLTPKEVDPNYVLQFLLVSVTNYSLSVVNLVETD
jgi:hypothetical protein